jgi:hypothetical protein
LRGSNEKLEKHFDDTLASARQKLAYESSNP